MTAVAPDRAQASAARLPPWRSEPASALALLLLSIVLGALLLARPRELSSLQLPELTLSREEVARALYADRRAARAAPHSEPAEALRALLRVQAAAEVRGLEYVGTYHRRHAQLAAAWKRLVQAEGESAALRLRAERAVQMEAALDLALPKEEARLALGAMPIILERLGASVDGRLVAPRFVARTLFKVHFNDLVGLGPEARLSEIERQAFFGWKAFHGDKQLLRDRLGALDAYARAGGRHVEEATGVLRFIGHDYAGAAAALKAAHEAEPSMRLRNYVVTAQARADASR